MPKDILDRNIKKASDAKQADFSELVYEAYGPGGTGWAARARRASLLGRARVTACAACFMARVSVGEGVRMRHELQLSLWGDDDQPLRIES